MMTQRRKYGDERRAGEKRRVARQSALRQACVAKTRASGMGRVMNVEEKKWYVEEFGRQPPRGC